MYKMRGIKSENVGNKYLDSFVIVDIAIDTILASTGKNITQCFLKDFLFHETTAAISKIMHKNMLL